MASFLIYCPCKLKEIGLGVIHHGRDGNGVGPYLYFQWINERHEKAQCVFCGGTVRRVGADPKADKKSGVTKKMIRNTWKEHDKWMKETPNEN